MLLLLLCLSLSHLSLCVVPRYVLVKAMRICARDEHWGGVEQLLELMLKQGHTPTPAALHFRCALSAALSNPYLAPYLIPS